MNHLREVALCNFGVVGSAATLGLDLKVRCVEIVFLEAIDPSHVQDCSIRTTEEARNRELLARNRHRRAEAPVYGCRLHHGSVRNISQVLVTFRVRAWEQQLR
jgi:hypothetical protein